MHRCVNDVMMLISTVVGGAYSFTAADHQRVIDMLWLYSEVCISSFLCGKILMKKQSHGICLDTQPNRKIILSSALQVKSGTIFDNFLITDDPKLAEEVGNETWGKTKVRPFFSTSGFTKTRMCLYSTHQPLCVVRMQRRR